MLRSMSSSVCCYDGKSRGVNSLSERLSRVGQRWRWSHYVQSRLRQRGVGEIAPQSVTDRSFVHRSILLNTFECYVILTLG
jgi:hypothetical protein